MAATQAQVDNLVGLLDGYAQKGGHHLNVNVLNRETLQTAGILRRNIRSLPSVYPDTQ